MTATPQTPLRMGVTEWAFLLILSVIWGASFFFYRVMVPELPPFTIVLGRLSIGALALHAFLALRGDPMRFPWRVWARFAALGVLNNVVPFTLIAYSEMRITGGLASLLHGSVPMMTAVVAHLFTHDEKLSWNRITGILFGFAGVAVLIGRDAVHGLANSDFAGELICLAAAVVYAFSGVYSRTFTGIAPLKIATGQVTMGALVALPLAMIVDRPWTLPAPSTPVWLSLLTIALVGSSFAYILFFRVVARAGATNMSVVTFLQPVSALMLGWAFLGERISANAVAGLAVIATGLAFMDGRPLKWIARPRRGGRAAAPP